MAGDNAFCTACGHDVAATPDIDHDACRAHAVLDPPRFCGRCGRRLDVRVHPTGYVATCRSCDGIHPARRTTVRPS